MVKRSNEHEAATALRQALALMREYVQPRLDMPCHQ
ncbi:hypothetical protein [Limnohabitans sp.]|nr:hypothetical protein [Limnohabitans sp.]